MRTAELCMYVQWMHGYSMYVCTYVCAQYAIVCVCGSSRLGLFLSTVASPVITEGSRNQDGQQITEPLGLLVRMRGNQFQGGFADLTTPHSF